MTDIKISATKNTKKAKLHEKIAKGIIWFFVALTLIVLVWIIGYILYRGFYYNLNPAYDVTPIKEKVLRIDEKGEHDFIVIAHKGIRINKDLTIYHLREIFNKRKATNWGFYTRQDIKARPFAYPISTPLGAAFQRYILDPQREEYRDYIKTADSVEEMISLVGENEGGVGIIPADKADLLANSNVQAVLIRRIALIANESVFSIENNKQLQTVDGKYLKDIFTGKITNWSEVEGIDLPMNIIAPPSREPRYSGLMDKLFEGHGRLTGEAFSTRTLDEYMEKIATTPGALGLAYYSDVDFMKTPKIVVNRGESGINLTLDFIIEPPARSGQWGGISNIIINTFILILLTLLFSAPLGIAAAVYLVEYAKQGRLVRILRMGTETLAGIPSIIFGLFGYIVFVQILDLKIGFISATLSVTLMVLPTIIRTTEEALKSVPKSYREGSLALGATKLSTIIKVVLPAASPGIVTGIILAIGRTVGETAVLLNTLGSSYALFSGFTSSARVLSLHLYLLFSEAYSFERAFATGTVLIIIILAVNLITTKVIGRMNKNLGK